MDWLPVFKDQKLDKALRKNGIVKFKMGSVQMVEDCKTKLSELNTGYDHNIGEHFYGSVSITEKKTKEAIHQAFSSILTPYLESLLIHHRLLTYFYLVKVVGKKSVLNIHQDWSIIDERKYRAYNLWIPLVESTVENGTIYAIKGSQNFPLNIRGANIPPKFLNHFDVAKKYLKPILVKKGEALLFDSRLIHFSPPNQSSEARTAVINNIIPLAAETYSFCGEKSGDSLKINQYKVPEDLFIHYNDFVNQKDSPNPKGELIGEIEFGNINAISEEEFKRLIDQFAVKKKWYEVF